MACLPIELDPDDDNRENANLPITCGFMEALTPLLRTTEERELSPGELQGFVMLGEDEPTTLQLVLSSHGGRIIRHPHMGNLTNQP